jgi:hypothetical protein
LRRIEVAEERTVEMPAEWGCIVHTEVFIDEVRRIVDETAKRGIPIKSTRTVGEVGSGSSERLDSALEAAL